MCAQCDAFHTTVRLADSAAYAAALTEARAAVGRGDLEAVEESTALSAPGGHARHLFACSLCAQLFILEVGGGHVLGDQWRPLHGN